jgi:hypothetical protein
MHGERGDAFAFRDARNRDRISVVTVPARAR